MAIIDKVICMDPKYQHYKDSKTAARHFMYASFKVLKTLQRVSISGIVRIV